MGRKNNDSQEGNNMVRDEYCPQCGSKRITVIRNARECTVCKYTWTGRKHRGKSPRKDKERTTMRRER